MAYVVVDAGHLQWRVGCDEDSVVTLAAWDVPALQRRAYLWAELRKFLAFTEHDNAVALFTVGVFDGPDSTVVAEIANECFGFGNGPAIFESLMLVPQEYCAMCASRGISRGAIATALSVNLGSELSIYGFYEGYCIGEIARRFPNPLVRSRCPSTPWSLSPRRIGRQRGLCPPFSSVLQSSMQRLEAMGYTALRRLLLTSDDAEL
eukprot:1365069-Prymnesium_polylepis.1